MELWLIKNDGYQWFKNGDTAFKGFFIDELTGVILRGNDAIKVLEKISDYEELKNFLSHTDGSFAFVIKKHETIWAGVDVARSMPLFYSAAGDVISDSVKVIIDKKRLKTNDLDVSAVEEFVHDAYIGHGRTLYKNIKQLDAGQIAKFTDLKVEKEYYYIHKADIQQYSREEALSQFDYVSKEIFNDVLRIVGDRPIVISLSGGYDSRYIACMLKELGAKDVSCYTYGRGETFEVLKSRQVAEKLGYRWTFVDYSDKVMGKYFNGKYLDFFDCYEGRDGIPYVQNYVAVMELQERKWFKPNSVFITGLCNDMQTGAYTLPQEEISNFEPTIDFLVEHLIKRRNFRNTLGKRALSEYETTLREVIAEMNLEKINDYQEFVQATEAIEAILMHSRLFLHMNDIHAMMGYEWVLPCWSKKSLNYWYGLPKEFRVRQNLYEEWQLTSIPRKYNIAEKKKVITYTLYSGVDRMKARLHLLAKRLILFPLGISINEETNFNNFNLISARYFKQVEEKGVLKFRNLSVIHIMALYCAEQWISGNVCNKIISEYESARNKN